MGNSMKELHNILKVYPGAYAMLQKGRIYSNS